MTMYMNPVSASVASWQFFGKAYETQLRVSTQMGRAMIEAFKFKPISFYTKEAKSEFTSKRPAATKTVTAPAKPKPAARKAAAPKKKPAAKSAATVAKTAAPAPAVKKPAATKAKSVAAKTAPAPKTEAAPKIEAATPKRKTRAPSKPPEMPENPTK